MFGIIAVFSLSKKNPYSDVDIFAMSDIFSLVMFADALRMSL
jgi:hypothetical protein